MNAALRAACVDAGLFMFRDFILYPEPEGTGKDLVSQVAELRQMPPGLEIRHDAKRIILSAAALCLLDRFSKGKSGIRETVFSGMYKKTVYEAGMEFWKMACRYQNQTPVFAAENNFGTMGISFGCYVNEHQPEEGIISLIPSLPEQSLREQLFLAKRAHDVAAKLAVQSENRVRFAGEADEWLNVIRNLKTRL